MALLGASVICLILISSLGNTAAQEGGKENPLTKIKSLAENGGEELGGAIKEGTQKLAGAVKEGSAKIGETVKGGAAKFTEMAGKVGEQGQKYAGDFADKAKSGFKDMAKGFRKMFDW